MGMVMVSGGLHGLAESVKFEVIVRGYRQQVWTIIYVGIPYKAVPIKKGNKSWPAAAETYSYIHRNTYVLAVQFESYDYIRRNTYILAIHH